jgi:hypothetical protein
MHGPPLLRQLLRLLSWAVHALLGGAEPAAWLCCCQLRQQAVLQLLPRLLLLLRLLQWAGRCLHHLPPPPFSSVAGAKPCVRAEPLPSQPR